MADTVAVFGQEVDDLNSLDRDEEGIQPHPILVTMLSTSTSSRVSIKAPPHVEMRPTTALSKPSLSTSTTNLHKAGVATGTRAATRRFQDLAARAVCA